MKDTLEMNDRIVGELKFKELPQIDESRANINRKIMAKSENVRAIEVVRKPSMAYAS